MIYLLIGNRGQLGKEFQKVLSGKNVSLVSGDIDEIDIRNLDNLYKFTNNIKPDIIINCAAYNLVDNAEAAPEEAFLTNAEAVKNLAIVANENNSLLIHFGTDYVFDGTKGTLYTESDIPNPVNVYGQSKLQGEVYLAEIAKKYLLLRTSWVYGDGVQNFVYKFLQWSKTNKVLQIADDEISIPTSTEVLVNVTLEALRKGLTGLFHLTNSGHASRFKWAKVIAQFAGLSNEILPVSKDIFNLPAKRPGFSAMANNLITGQLQVSIPTWEESLKNYLERFQEESI
ncbi:MAG: dTDP-4-dehydrorhamnose reductase [Bacteroidota bacterium]|jgi:dTDP-4-dehydrorhamnose reductase